MRDFSFCWKTQLASQPAIFLIGLENHADSRPAFPISGFQDTKSYCRCYSGWCVSALGLAESLCPACMYQIVWANHCLGEPTVWGEPPKPSLLFRALQFILSLTHSLITRERAWTPSASAPKSCVAAPLLETSARHTAVTSVAVLCGCICCPGDLAQAVAGLRGADVAASRLHCSTLERADLATR